MRPDEWAAEVLHNEGNCSHATGGPSECHSLALTVLSAALDVEELERVLERTKWGHIKKVAQHGGEIGPPTMRDYAQVIVDHILGRDES